MTISPRSNMSMERQHQVVSLDAAVLVDVAKLFDVLAEPTRLQILQVLANGPQCVGDLVERLGAKQANVSKQLGILHDAKLVRRERDGLLVRYSVSEPLIYDLCSLVCGKLRADAEARVAALPVPRGKRKR